MRIGHLGLRTADTGARIYSWLLRHPATQKWGHRKNHHSDRASTRHALSLCFITARPYDNRHVVKFRQQPTSPRVCGVKRSGLMCPRDRLERFQLHSAVSKSIGFGCLHPRRHSCAALTAGRWLFCATSRCGSQLLRCLALKATGHQYQAFLDRGSKCDSGHIQTLRNQLTTGSTFGLPQNALGL